MSRRTPLSPHAFAALQQIHVRAKACRNFVIQERRILALLVVVGALCLSPSCINEVGNIHWMSIIGGMAGVGVIYLLGTFLPQQVSDALNYSVSLVGALLSILIWIAQTPLRARVWNPSHASIAKLSKVGTGDNFLRPLRD